MQRVSAVWGPGGAPHHLIYGASGTGKATIIKSLLMLAEYERVLIFEPKRNADEAYENDSNPWLWGRPVNRIEPRFGFEEEYSDGGGDGGGPDLGPLPGGMWYRIQGSPDRKDTAARFGDALDIVANEGHCVVVLDDVKETCKALKLAGKVESLMNLGRSARVYMILATTETSYVAGRSQGSILWVGHTGGQLGPAKQATQLLGWRGKDAEDYCAALKRFSWIYKDGENGSEGPVLIPDQGPLTT